MTLVREKGLEPPRLAALEPKSSASTNSATFAERGILPENILYCQPLCARNMKHERRKVKNLRKHRKATLCHTLFTVVSAHAC